MVLLSLKKELIRPGKTVGSSVESYDDILKLGIIIARAERLNTLYEFRLSLFIGPLKNILKNVSPDKSCLTVINNPEIGIQSYILKMIPDNIQTEGVSGGDKSTVDQRLLSEKVLVIGILLQHFPDLLKDSFLHLRGCGLGESDDQDPVDINGILLIAHKGNYPLYKYCGLTASCSGTYKKAGVPGIYYPCLFFSRFKRHLHHLLYRFPFYLRIYRILRRARLWQRFCSWYFLP